MIIANANLTGVYPYSSRTVLIFWGIYDLILLAGPSRLANHWGYWQDYVGLFNAENPSGNVTGNALYLQILQVAIGVGVAVSLKRLAVGMFLGRQTFGTQIPCL